jgi:hypothetical protein
LIRHDRQLDGGASGEGDQQGKERLAEQIANCGLQIADWRQDLRATNPNSEI